MKFLFSEEGVIVINNLKCYRRRDKELKQKRPPLLNQYALKIQRNIQSLKLSLLYHQLCQLKELYIKKF